MSGNENVPGDHIFIRKNHPYALLQVKMDAIDYGLRKLACAFTDQASLVWYESGSKLPQSKNNSKSRHNLSLRYGQNIRELPGQIRWETTVWVMIETGLSLSKLVSKLMSRSWTLDLFALLASNPSIHTVKPDSSLKITFWLRMKEALESYGVTSSQNA